MNCLGATRRSACLPALALMLVAGCSDSDYHPRRTRSTGSWSPPETIERVEPAPSAPLPRVDVSEPEMDPLERARGTRTEEIRRRLAETSGTRGMLGKGIGGVVTFGRVPWKVVVKDENTTLYDAEGHPLRLARPSVPYFVFEQRGENLLIGRLQDRDCVNRNGGWLNAADCLSWYSRRLVYPTPDSGAAQALEDGLGSEYALPEYDVERAMPWPILAETATADWLVLCDLRHYGSGFWPLPIQYSHIEEFDIFVIFSETELDQTITNITALSAIVDSGRVPVEELPKAVGSFLTQNEVDFLDLDEVRRTVDLFPGGSPDFLMKRELDSRMKRLIANLVGQLRWLLRVVRSRGYYNEAHSIYVVPLDDLNRIKLETD